MLLTKLELMGFKTFADRTELEFCPGVTAVVGPNGTGKSNIADAVLWALGEQNIRNIRGVRLEDVIFAGSEKRKPLGMAEVSLTFDNSCGTLPVEYSEVTITRRAYRSGESEYFINRHPCRLKDIYELFLDTGLGREAYSIISQGEVDAILSAKPEDRRFLFEEAAGVKKYRHRRKEATRKLESAEQNLRRVNDIVHELSSQLEPLAEQAEIAVRYNELSARLRQIEIGLLINDLRRLTSELEKIRLAKIDGSERIADYDKKISNLEARKSELAEQLSELEQRIDQARTFHQEVQSATQQLESRLALIDERENAYRDNCANLANEIEQLKSRAEETDSRLKRMELELEGSREREATLSAESSALSAKLADLDCKFLERSKVMEEQRASFIKKAAELESKNRELENRQAAIPQLQKRAKQIQEEITRLESERHESLDQFSESEKLVELFRDEMSQLENRLRVYDQQLADLNENLKTLDEQRMTLQKEYMAKASRLQAVREMAEAHEGFYQGVRSISSAAKTGRLHGHYAVVADILRVPNGLETAIEAALGSSVQDIITENAEEAKRAIQFLKDTQSGRATFLPLKDMRPTAGPTPDISKTTGVLGIAADLVHFDKKYAPAINVLLAKTVVCEDIDSAVIFSRKTAGWSKIVTLDGEVIIPTGAMTGGSRISKGPNLIARKTEMENLADALHKSDSQISACISEIEALQSKINALSHERAACEKTIADLRVALAEQEKRKSYCQQHSDSLLRQIESAVAEMDELSASLQAETAKATQLAEELQSAGEGNVELDEKVSQSQRELDNLKAQREETASYLMRVNVELASVKERIGNLEKAISSARSDLEQMRLDISTKHQQLESSASQIAVDAAERVQLTAEIESQRESVTAAAEELSNLLDQKSELAWSIGRIEQDLRAAISSRAELSDLVHDSDVKEARLDMQVNQAAARLEEEYEITLEQALNWPEDIEVKYGTAAEVSRLRKEMKAMGNVNTGAIQEYQRLKERWDFLMAQKADLEEARNSINAAIKEIDDSTRDVFMNTFNAVAVHFDEMFKTLFGGGRAQIMLTNPEDLLETGIDIIVQPPGKKLQDLSLLSGGEKSLAACALLFALLTVKPSPFVIMDEVDAALDESNVERFADLVKQFAHKTQFVVITHNKATMEAAGTLYGVTMQEPGVSKLISVKLAEDTEELEPLPEEALISDAAAQALERAASSKFSTS